jgi:hypothetical protein
MATTMLRSDSEFCRTISNETGAIALESDYVKGFVNILFASVN